MALEPGIYLRKNQAWLQLGRGSVSDPIPDPDPDPGPDPDPFPPSTTAYPAGNYYPELANLSYWQSAAPISDGRALEDNTKVGIPPGTALTDPGFSYITQSMTDRNFATRGGGSGPTQAWVDFSQNSTIVLTRCKFPKGSSNFGGSVLRCENGSPGDRLILIDCELDAQIDDPAIDYGTGNVVVLSGGVHMIAIRTLMHGTGGDFVRINGSLTLIESRLTEANRHPDSHSDVFQRTSGGTGEWLRVYGSCISEPQSRLVADRMSAGIVLTNSPPVHTDITFEGTAWGVMAPIFGARNSPPESVVNCWLSPLFEPDVTKEPAMLNSSNAVWTNNRVWASGQHTLQGSLGSVSLTAGEPFTKNHAQGIAN